MAAAFTGGGRYALDAPVAAFAGLSVAFLIFAMPGDVLAELVGSTGLASLVPAAEPPLGVKARIGIGAAAAMAVFAVAFLTLRWLDRFGTRSAEEAEPAAEMAAPRLRRRDFHPDAPPRPPIMATDEFGEPDEVRPVPAFEPMPREAEEEWLLDQPAAFDEGPADPLPPPPAEPPAAAASIPSAPDLPAASGSLDELMARLEQGLARRRIGEPAPTPAEPAAPPEPLASPEPKPFREAGDDRLQSAIDSLQRLAARSD